MPRVPPEHTRAILAAVASACPKLFSGLVPLPAYRELEPALGHCRHHLSVLLTDADGAPCLVYLLSDSPLAPQQKRLAASDAAREAAVWLNLRNASEVACSPTWSSDLPPALDGLPRPRFRARRLRPA